MLKNTMINVTANIFIKSALTIVIYYLCFSVVLLHANTALLKFIGVHGWFLYIVMSQHFIISLVFGYFWERITGIKTNLSVLSSLLLPTSFTIIIISLEFLTPTPGKNTSYIIAYIAVCQYIGVLLGSFINFKQNDVKVTKGLNFY